MWLINSELNSIYYSIDDCCKSVDGMLHTSPQLFHQINKLAGNIFNFDKFLIAKLLYTSFNLNAIRITTKSAINLFFILSALGFFSLCPHFSHMYRTFQERPINI